MPHLTSFAQAPPTGLTSLIAGSDRMTHLLLIFITTTTLIARAADENKAVFQDMCRILRLTLKQPEVPKLPGNIDVKDRATSVLDSIQILNFSLAEPSLIAYIVKADTLEEVKTANEATKTLSDGDWDYLKKNIDTMKGTGPASLSARAPKQISETARVAAHRQVGLFYSQAKSLFETLSSEELNLEKAVKKARKSLVTAAYGVEVATGEHGSGDKPEKDKKKATVAAVDTTFWKNDHSTKKGCGGVASDDSNAIETGKTLAADILCLCDQHSTGLGTTGGACGFNGLSRHGTPWTIPTSGKSSWDQIAAKCTDPPSDEVTPIPSPENLAEALARFYGLLGTGGENVAETSFATTSLKGKSYILGAFSIHQGSKPECDGQAPTTSNSRGICVNYYPLVETGKEIPWVKNVKKAIEELQRVRDIFGHQKDILTKMELLEISAQQTALVATTPAEGASQASEPSSGTQGNAKPTGESAEAIKAAAEERVSTAYENGKMVLIWTAILSVLTLFC